MYVTRIRNTVGAVLAGAVLTVTGSATANAQSPRSADPTPSSIQAEAFLLMNHSGKVLQPVSSANGARVVQQAKITSGDTTSQYWFKVLDNPYFSFENFGTGKNLGIDGASTSAGAGAIQANGSSDHNQDWVVDDDAYIGANFALRNRKSGLCLGISGGSTANGAQAAQFKCDGSPNQSWLLTH
jgi:hypothetical protein